MWMTTGIAASAASGRREGAEKPISQQRTKGKVERRNGKVRTGASEVESGKDEGQNSGFGNWSLGID
jgi:hypothetical protein